LSSHDPDAVSRMSGTIESPETSGSESQISAEYNTDTRTNLTVAQHQKSKTRILQLALQWLGIKSQNMDTGTGLTMAQDQKHGQCNWPYSCTG